METGAKEGLCTPTSPFQLQLLMGTSGTGQSQTAVVLNPQLSRDTSGILPTSGTIWGTLHCFSPSPGRQRVELLGEETRGADQARAPLWPDSPFVLPALQWLMYTHHDTLEIFLPSVFQRGALLPAGLGAILDACPPLHMPVSASWARCILVV